MWTIELEGPLESLGIERQICVSRYRSPVKTKVPHSLITDIPGTPQSRSARFPTCRRQEAYNMAQKYADCCGSDLQGVDIFKVCSRF